MVIFRILTFICILVFVLTFAYILKRKSGIISKTGLFLVSSVLMLIICFVVINPTFAQNVADLIGIGRGVDLIFYSSILFILFVLFAIYVHVRRMNGQLIFLARELSILKTLSRGDKRIHEGAKNVE